eukprot:9272837-Ditylum_brightwellii.AAC.1
MENQGRNKQFRYGNNSSNNTMAPKLNTGVERKHSITQEEMEKRDQDRSSMEIDTSLSSRGHSITKGTCQDGKESSNNTLSTKSNDGTEVGNNNVREEEDQIDYELENLEKTETDYLCPAAQENGWCPNNATQTNHEMQLKKGTKQRQQTNQGGIAETR